jgi:hypothetical protein
LVSRETFPKKPKCGIFDDSKSTRPAAAWELAIGEWALTAIDLRKYRVFSMICYIGMGWAVLPFAPQAMGLRRS